MSCCGKKREELKNFYSGDNPDTAVLEHPGKYTLPIDISFEYTGEKSLTVTGSISRKQYFFSQKGDVLSVNNKDAPGMMGVPNVKKVKS